MGKFEDELDAILEEDDPQLAKKMKDVHAKAKRAMDERLREAAAAIEKDMEAEFRKFKSDLHAELEKVRRLAQDLTELDAGAASASAAKLKDATAALAQYLEEREERFAGLGQKVGAIVRSKLVPI